MGFTSRQENQERVSKVLRGHKIYNVNKVDDDE